jgi:hypothetical protein
VPLSILPGEALPATLTMHLLPGTWTKMPRTKHAIVVNVTYRVNGWLRKSAEHRVKLSVDLDPLYTTIDKYETNR